MLFIPLEGPKNAFSDNKGIAINIFTPEYTMNNKYNYIHYHVVFLACKDYEIRFLNPVKLSATNSLAVCSCFGTEIP